MGKDTVLERGDVSGELVTGLNKRKETSMFVAYPKIHRLGVEENEGILDNEVFVQEKVDGANTSIWFEDGVLKMGSRTRELEDGFNGFCEYVRQHEGIRKFFERYPKTRMYGEWLVRHTIAYNKTAYRQFYLFDVQTPSGEYWTTREVELVAESFGIRYPTIFAYGKLTEEEIREHVGKTAIGDKGEGVVIKRAGFVNKFGNHCYAKIVTQAFNEDNALVFGGNNKHSETYWEMFVVNKYCTLPRVQKVMNKLQPIIEERLDFKHTTRIAGTCYHDMITEECWEIASKVPILDYRQLKKLASKKFIQIYHDLLNGTVSVADTGNLQDVTIKETVV